VLHLDALNWGSIWRVAIDAVIGNPEDLRQRPLCFHGEDISNAGSPK